MLFEKTIQKYWGTPETNIYFSSYYGDNFEMRAILFSIVVHELNYKANEYSEEKLSLMKDYELKSNQGKVTHNDNLLILQLFANHLY